MDNLDSIVVSDIEETPLGWRAEVVVGGEDDATAHTVSLSRTLATKLSGQDDPDPREILVKTFDFLLHKEPKESILQEFDVSTVSTFFPDFEQSFTANGQ